MELKSSRFRKEREQTWRELETLVWTAEKKGLRSLTADELMLLPRLYRATLSSLSVARSISLDRALTAYLETLASRAYLFVYGTRSDLGQALGNFFRRDLPAAVRSMAKPFLLALLALVVGWVAGHFLTLSSPDWFYTLVDNDLAGGRTPTATREFLEKSIYTPEDKQNLELGVFATWLFTHNAKVGMFAFALGFALGVPTFLLMFFNGATMGAMTAVFAKKGLGLAFGGWLAIHGTTELLAVVLCGAAGLTVGAAVAFPGEHPRLAMVARAGRRASLVVLGAVGMLLVAGVLEGVGRQVINDTVIRYGIGLVMLAIWAAYFIGIGRGGGADGDR